VSQDKTAVSGRKPNIIESVFIIIAAVVLILSAVIIFGADTHIPLVLASCIASLVSLFVLKVKWSVIEEGILGSILMGMQAILILYTVGILIGVWIKSGVVPAMIYYGLNLLNPSMFLLATLWICSVVSLATGSSWGTSGTVGIALMGIGSGLGIPAPISAGFVISGAYFGDKMSPLSDTTNLAPAMAGTDIFQHIRAMVWTTGPTYLIVMIVAGVIGMRYAEGSLDAGKIEAIQVLLKAEFHVSPIGFIPPLLVILLAASKKPAIPSIFAGVIAGGLLAVFQGAGFSGLIDTLQNGYAPALSGAVCALGEDMTAITALLADNGITNITAETASEACGILTELLSRGGLQSMNWTVSLILCALAFGGIIERVGYLEVFLDTFLKKVKSPGGLCTSVIVSCCVTNVLTGDQYISIVLPGRMMKEKFSESGLHPRMLSRSLEDSATLTSVLVPWNSCAAYHFATLGVDPLAYAPYAILNWLNAIVAIVMTYMGIGVAWKTKDCDIVISRTKPASAAAEG
jgi:NhaC family Na+:H+ antiporter